MKEEEISIGSSEDCDILVRDPTISRHHAKLRRTSDGAIWIEDTNSKNGIFVNNRRIQKCKIDEKDHILLGGKLIENPYLFGRLNKILKHRKTDYTQEYKEVVKLMEVYHSKKSKIMDGNKWPKMIRIALSILLVLILLFFPDLIPDPNMRYVLIVAIGTIPVLMNVFMDNKAKKQEKADLLRLEYEDLIECPKCKTKLMQFTPVYMKAKGKCVNEKCNAVYHLD